MNSALIRLCISTLLTMLGFGAVIPVVLVQLSQQGYGATSIGILSALPYVGVWLVAPFQPALALRFGMLPSYQIGKVLIIIAFLGLSQAHGVNLWAVLLILLGMGGALVWPPTDSLVADYAPSSKEGSVTGLYHTGIASVFAVGPLAAAFLVQNPTTVYLAAAVIAAASSWPLVRVSLDEAAADPSDHREPFAWRFAAGLIFLSLLGGFFETSSHIVSQLVALELKWDVSAAVALPGVVVAGSLLTQYAVGRMADGYGLRKVLYGAMATMVLSSAALPLVMKHPASLWVIALFWGAAGGGLYTLAMTGIARKYSGPASATATTLIIISYTAGSTLGPLTGGILVDISPLQGAAWTFSIFALTGMIFGRRSAD